MKRTIPILAAILLLITAAGAIAESAVSAEDIARSLREQVQPYDDRFCENVFVNGVDLGGMTADEARAAVWANLHENRWYIRLVWADGSAVTGADGQPLVIDWDSVGVTFDVEGALARAWERGHTGSDQDRADDMRELAASPYRTAPSATPMNLPSLMPMLNALAEAVRIEPRDAYFDEETGFDPYRTDPFTIEPEIIGRELDMPALQAEITRMAYAGERGDLVLPVRVIMPRVTEASLRAERFTLIGEAATPISTTSTEERNNNIRRAFELVSGVVIQPGRQFSFNGIVGERTLANGFFPATEYVYGEHTEGVGGGVCQASSTIYVAAVRANLRIVSRTPHSLQVNYTDFGKDATVYWYDRHRIDLKFANDTDYPIYITASVRQNPDNRRRLQCYVRIYGPGLGEGVTYDLVTEETVIPAPEETEVRRDKNSRYVLYTDEQYVLQEAADGMSVQSWRVRYENGVEVSREPLYTDTYDPKQRIVYVGIRERPTR